MIRKPRLAWLSLLLCLSFSAHAQEPAATPEPAAEPAPAEAPADPRMAVWQAANRAMQHGPVDVPLVDQAVLHLPEGYGYVPKTESIAVMESMGNTVDGGFLGLIFPLAEESQWFVSLRYQNDGHIKDDDAKEWDADDLLKSLKEGTEEGNKFRAQKGIPAIEVTGWIESPTYDASSHRLVWSVGIKDKGVASGSEDGVNYNTYVLGREGYISLDLITSVATVEAEKPIAKQLLAAVDFKEGRRYADFNASTDHVAEYGLAALVGGVALKKLGLFAAVAAFFAKFFKLIIVAVVGGAAALRRLFGGKG